MKLQTSLIWPGCAQGKYMIKAKGFFLSILRWGNEDGPLPDWSPISYIPIDPAGNGVFFYPGRRAIPREATHVWVQCVSHDFSQFESASAPIPERFLPEKNQIETAQRFSVLTDLHLSAKPWRIRQALARAASDTILLLGDAVNDGLPEQFRQFLDCIEETVPEKNVLPVPGNHDITHPRFMDEGGDGVDAYAGFQKELLSKAERNGDTFTRDPGSLAWSVQRGGLDLIGLQCVIDGRLFRFPEGAQLDWLEEHLETHRDADRHLILCHAPLLKHNPNRNDGNPYLDKNKRLQELLDRYGNILFLSGHTHVSPNLLRGSGEYDERTDNIYLDCGSAAVTDTGGERGLMSPDWKDGCITELSVASNEVEICMRSIETGIKFPRGYYRFYTKKEHTEG